MEGKSQIAKINSELREGMDPEKCRKCGGMKQGLENPSSDLPSVEVKGSSVVLKNVEHCLKFNEPKKRTRRA